VTTLEHIQCLVNMWKAVASGPPYARREAQEEIDDRKDDAEYREFGGHW
jgi:hypothetical protein